jgi:hypothetical protein
MPRRLVTPLCAVAAVVVLGGCGGASHAPAAGAPPAAGASAANPSGGSTTGAPARPPVDLSKTAACTLATSDEAAAALGVPVTRTYSVPPLDGIGCEYATAASKVYLLVQVQHDPDMYFDRNPRQGRPVPGLGDAAFTGRSIMDGGEKIEVLAGDLVLTIQRVDPAAPGQSDLAAIDDRLAKLAHLVFARLPR